MGIDVKRFESSSARLAEAPQTSARAGSVVRFDPHQRVQHALMMSSFIILALTGLPQKFSGLGLSQWWVQALGGLEIVRTIHRTAGFIMLSDCLYHLGYLTYRMGVQRQLGPLRMLPGPHDLRDAFQTILYFLGVAPAKPRFDRFSYLEKFDYWAVFWGIFMIGGSGLMLVFPVLATRVLPGQVIPVAIVIHSDEAILAVGWILVVHMFNVHLAPWVFPFNPAIFTGKLTTHQCAEDHPLEWERLVAAERAPAPAAKKSPAASRRRRMRRIYARRRRLLARAGHLIRSLATSAKAGAGFVASKLARVLSTRRAMS